MGDWVIFKAIAVAVVLLVLAMAVLAVVSRRTFMRAIFRPVLSLLYRKRVVGLENLPRDGGCVVISNHISWIDGILILWMLPRNVRFVVAAENFNGGVMQWIAGAFDTILMSASPKSIARALKSARDGLHDGDVVGVFPEGSLSRTGQLHGFKPGIKKILKGTDAPVIPMWHEGMWGSVFSFSGGKFFWKWPRQFRRQITLYIGEPLAADTPLDVMRSRVQDLGARASVETRRRYPVLPSRVIRVWRRRGRRMQAADSTGVEVGGRALLTRVFALRRALRREIFDRDEKFVGILLPPSVAGVAVNVALAMDRRISSNLNYTVTSDVLNHCTESLGVRHVLTSRKFMDKFDFELSAETVMLEDLRDKITTMDKVVAFIQANLIPAVLLDRMLGLNRIDSDDLLTVIFTSGSTGMPKGVMLSHANISHNVDGIERLVRLDSEDNVLGVLPFFHSFGYSVTLWAVNTLGPAGVYHFNPLDSKQVGKLAKRYHATVLLGTPTFMRGYLRRVTPDQFADLDVVVVGAEKMPPDLFDAFEQRFGVRPIEGYGATELSPLVAVNIPPSRSAAKHQRDRLEGSVGRPFPGLGIKIVSPDDGHELPAGEDGMLIVSGPNVMRGYAGQDDLTAEAITSGWYTTGDIAHVDAEGFLHITGRLSRFSKIGGEMVPHVRVEEVLLDFLESNQADAPEPSDGHPDVPLCVTSVPDEKKGERLLVLLAPGVMNETIHPDSMRKALTDAGLPNLFVPARDAFVEVDHIPLLGTGKLDLKGVKDKAVELSGSPVS
ncbi:AMP-binding protein [Crateriforma conspicua]|uniref:AMP-binding protein n=1 Tax=Crateriforma conspicua TaxID=2527996 RepID=UPI00118CD5CC|nr:AMP-binding protein [Crateriforma conspicua]QDV61322.1 Bifunctional protein Aas [Crateriforma conspicua]